MYKVKFVESDCQNTTFDFDSESFEECHFKTKKILLKAIHMNQRRIIHLNVQGHHHEIPWDKLNKSKFLEEFITKNPNEKDHYTLYDQSNLGFEQVAAFLTNDYHKISKEYYYEIFQYRIVSYPIRPIDIYEGSEPQTRKWKLENIHYLELNPLPTGIYIYCSFVYSQSDGSPFVVTLLNVSPNGQRTEVIKFTNISTKWHKARDISAIICERSKLVVESTETICGKIYMTLYPLVGTCANYFKEQEDYLSKRNSETKEEEDSNIKTFPLM